MARFWKIFQKVPVSNLLMFVGDVKMVKTVVELEKGKNIGGGCKYRGLTRTSQVSTFALRSFQCQMCGASRWCQEELPAVSCFFFSARLHPSVHSAPSLRERQGSRLTDDAHKAALFFSSVQRNEKWMLVYQVHQSQTGFWRFTVEKTHKQAND